jgi:type IV secretory pathway VirB4 component
MKLLELPILSSPADVSLAQSLRVNLGLSDYLPYEEIVEPDTILTSYGAFGAIFEVVWRDTSTMLKIERMRHAARINEGLTSIGKRTFGSNGWMVHSHALRMEADSLDLPAFVPSDGGRVLAKSRIEHLAGKRSKVRHLLSVTYLPPLQKDSKFKQWFVTGPKQAEQSYDRVRTEFLAGLQSLEQSLSNIGELRLLGTHPMDRERNELLEAIYQVIFDEVQPIVVGYPFEPAPIGGLLASHDINPVGVTPTVGRKHLRVLSIYGYPRRTKPDMLDQFLQTPARGCRFSTRTIFEDFETTVKRLEKKRNQHAGKKSSPFAWLSKSAPRVDQHAASEEKKADNAIAEAKTGIVAYAHLSAQAVFLNEDLEELTADAERVKRALTHKGGFTVTLEDANTVAAYLGHLPFVGHYNVTEGQAHTLNIARVWASSSAWGGNTNWDCKSCPEIKVPILYGLTRTGEDFAVDTHDEDSQSFVSYGRPGSGKTTLANKFSGEYRRTPMDQVFGIDVNFGQLVTCRFLGGDYRESQRIWLFANLESKAKRDFLAEFLVNLIALNGVKVQDNEVFIRALERMLQKNWRERTLTTFRTTIRPYVDTEIYNILGDYALGGIHDGCFDGEPDLGVGTNSYEVHELGALLGGTAKETVAAPMLLWHLNSFVDRMAGHRTLILVDEAWAALQSDIVARELGKIIRTARHRHGGVGFFTHSPSDVKDSAIGKIINAACKTKLLMPNPDAAGELEPFYGEKGMLLSPAEIKAVATAKEKDECALVTGGKFGIFSNRLSPDESVVYGATGKDEVTAARALMREYPPESGEFQERYMISRGRKAAAARLRSLRLNHFLDQPQAIREAILA